MDQNTEQFRQSVKDTLAAARHAEEAKTVADREMERALRAGIELLAGDVSEVSWHFDFDPECGPSGEFLPADVMLHMPKGRENILLGCDIELWQIEDNSDLVDEILEVIADSGIDYDNIQEALCIALAQRTGIPSWCVEDFLAALAQYIYGTRVAGRLVFGQCKQPEGAGMAKEVA